MVKIPLKVHEGGAAGNETGAQEDALLDDPLIKECLEDALGPWIRLMTREEVIEHRRFLTLFMTTHPVAAPIYNRLRKAAAGRSGDVAKDGLLLDGAEILDDGTEGQRR